MLVKAADEQRLRESATRATKSDAVIERIRTEIALCAAPLDAIIHINNIHEGVDESTGAGEMFSSRPVDPISVNHAIKIFVEAQGADLRRFDKNKKRVTLGTGSSLI
jgi:hypothetical protein